MSFQSLERQIVQAARVLLENPQFKLSELREWSTHAPTVRENLNHDELLLHLTDPDVWIAVPSAADKRQNSHNSGNSVQVREGGK